MLLIYWVPSGACNIYVTFLCWGVHMDPMVFNVHSAGVHRPPSLHNSLHSVSSAETEYWEDTLSSCAFVLCAAFICFLNYSSREKDVPYDSLLPTVNLFSLNLCFIVHHFLFSPFSRSLPSVVLYTVLPPTWSLHSVSIPLLLLNLPSPFYLVTLQLWFILSNIVLIFYAEL